MLEFGHDVSFEQARSQIGKGETSFIPVFLSAEEQRDHGKELEEWRGNRFKTEYLPLVRPFSGVPDLLRRVRDYAEVRAKGHITLEVAQTALDMLEVDRFGLDQG